MKNEAKKTAKTEAAESKKVLAVDASEAVKKAALPAPPQSQEVVQALWKKAQAAKAAAEQGLIPEEKAAAIWAEAEAASKPSPEALADAEKAKAAKQAAEKKEKTAKAAFEADLLSEAVFQATQAEAEKARQAYKEAAQAAKGYGPGSGGRCKGLMSGLDAAVKLLQESKEALQVGTICNKAIELGLWTPEGQTPAATLSAAIQKEVKKGEASRIVRTGKAGYFSARKSEVEAAAPQA